MRIAIVGSRDGFTKTDVNKIMLKYFFRTGNVLITGGARGVDTFAEEIAKTNSIEHEIIRPLNPCIRLDYLYRNCEIIGRADKIIAFWNGTSRGTKFVIDYAKARGKDIEVVRK